MSHNNLLFVPFLTILPFENARIAKYEISVLEKVHEVIKFNQKT